MVVMTARPTRPPPAGGQAAREPHSPAAAGLPAEAEALLRQLFAVQGSLPPAQAAAVAAQTGCTPQAALAHFGELQTATARCLQQAVERAAGAAGGVCSGGEDGGGQAEAAEDATSGRADGMASAPGDGTAPAPDEAAQWAAVEAASTARQAASVCLGELLDTEGSGGLRDASVTGQFVSLMAIMSSSVVRCEAAAVVAASRPTLRAKLLATPGFLATLEGWLETSLEQEHYTLSLGAMQALSVLPLEAPLLRSSPSLQRTVQQLQDSRHAGVAAAAGELHACWQELMAASGPAAAAGLAGRLATGAASPGVGSLPSPGLAGLRLPSSSVPLSAHPASGQALAAAASDGAALPAQPAGSGAAGAAAAARPVPLKAVKLEDVLQGLQQQQGQLARQQRQQQPAASQQQQGPLVSGPLSQASGGAKGHRSPLFRKIKARMNAAKQASLSPSDHGQAAPERSSPSAGPSQKPPPPPPPPHSAAAAAAAAAAVPSGPAAGVAPLQPSPQVLPATPAQPAGQPIPAHVAAATPAQPAGQPVPAHVAAAMARVAARAAAKAAASAAAQPAAATARPAASAAAAQPAVLGGQQQGQQEAQGQGSSRKRQQSLTSQGFPKGFWDTAASRDMSTSAAPAAAAASPGQPAEAQPPAAKRARQQLEPSQPQPQPQPQQQQQQHQRQEQQQSPQQPAQPPALQQQAPSAGMQPQAPSMQPQIGWSPPPDCEPGKATVAGPEGVPTLGAGGEDSTEAGAMRAERAGQEAARPAVLGVRRAATIPWQPKDPEEAKEEEERLRAAGWRLES